MLAHPTVAPTQSLMMVGFLARVSSWNDDGSQGKRLGAILDGYFNPLVFWYQWEYALTSKEFKFLQGI